MKVRYNRISTASQNLERQLERTHPDEVLYNDVISGSIPFAERPKGQSVIEEIKNDVVESVSVASIDRLGRNLLDIINTIETFHDYNVPLKVDNLGITSLVDGKPNATFRLIISVMASVAQMERETLLERQQEGIAIAKANGKYCGRARGSVESNEQFLAKYTNVVRLLKRGQSIRHTAKLAEVSIGTVQKVKRVMA